MSTERANGTKFKSEENESSVEQKYIFAGPLNLNVMSKKATTAMGSEIQLGENDFDALFLLATNEGESHTFQELYEVAWGKSETTDSLDVAQSALDKMIMQINSVGDEFMWIEFTPGEGYTFNTRWGHNWHTIDSKRSFVPRKRKAITVTPIIPINSKPSLIPANQANKTTATSQTQNTKPKSRKSPIIKILAGVGALAAAIALVLVLLYSTGIISPQEVEPVHIEIEDPSTPLASPDSTR